MPVTLRKAETNEDRQCAFRFRRGIHMGEMPRSMHLAGNLWFLWIFGDNIENECGPVRFLVFYLLCDGLLIFIFRRRRAWCALDLQGRPHLTVIHSGEDQAMFPSACSMRR